MLYIYISLLVFVPQVLGNIQRNPRQAYTDDEISGMTCEFIQQPVCRGHEYNHTAMPNLIGHTSQSEAAKRMNDYETLINLGCSRYLKFFLCTVYFPMCSPTREVFSVLKPCRSFCIYLKSRCEPLMASFRYSWSQDLDCNKIPSDSNMCIKPQNYELDNTVPVSDPQLMSPVDLIPELNKYILDKKREQSIPPVHERQCNMAQLKVTSNTANAKTSCVYRCDANVYYRQRDKNFASIWMAIWAATCAFSTLLTIITFLINTKRFRYPERPIIFLSICYFFYSLGYLIRVTMGSETVACRSKYEISFNTSNPTIVTSRPISPTAKFYIVEGQEDTWCTIVFLFLYFFSMASNLWWLILTFAWFLSAARKWGSEGVESISSAFHIVAWSVPAIKSVILILMHKIDADELTGLCYVGFQNVSMSLIFSIIPQITYLLIGLGFLMSGFCSLVSVRQDLKYGTALGLNPQMGMAMSQTNAGKLGNVNRLEKLIAKIGLFSVLYMVPRICVTGIEIYYYIYHDKWSDTVYRMSLTRYCVMRNGLDWNNYENCVGKQPYPSVELGMFYVFMCLIVGITTGLCVWCNRKSTDSLLKCLRLRSSPQEHMTTEFGTRNRPLNYRIGRQADMNNINDMNIMDHRLPSSLISGEYYENDKCF